MEVGEDIEEWKVEEVEASMVAATMAMEEDMVKEVLVGVVAVVHKVVVALRIHNLLLHLQGIGPKKLAIKPQQALSQ
jgi:ferredoxin-fold anticodon binding domain-containing protein